VLKYQISITYNIANRATEQRLHRWDFSRKISRMKFVNDELKEDKTIFRKMQEA
jgi:hypothetical protein